MRNELRCTATSKRTRQRCGRARRPGCAVCVVHGAGAPQVQRAAAERVAALVDPAIRGMSRALKSRDMGAVTRAATDILNRAGVRPDTHTSDDVRRLLSGVVQAVLRHVSDPREVAAISGELRMLMRRSGADDVAAGIPPPAPRPLAAATALPPAVDRADEEPLLLG